MLYISSKLKADHYKNRMLDFKNAFNSIRRDKVLEAARLHIPEIFPFVYNYTLATLPHPPSVLQIVACHLKKVYNKVTPWDPYSFASSFTL